MEIYHVDNKYFYCGQLQHVMRQIDYDHSLNKIFNENILQPIKRRHASQMIQKINNYF